MRPCPICGSTERREGNGRPRAGCVGCGSLERQRALAGGLADLLVPTGNGSGRVLECAPNSPMLLGNWLRDRGWHYESFDKRSFREPFHPGVFDRFVDHDADVTDMRFARTGGYELVLLQHVLEQVPDYLAGLDELARVVEPGGRAVLEIAWRRERPTTEPLAPNKHGHRWVIGADVLPELHARFASVEPRELVDEDGYKGTFFICRPG
ncbi:class I SAM-dependent methyltransferase [Capillimicrobium parvum]|uniref:Class I SAM-dependent methyltransferase n=1 Tax=Capillimicrobium parvum TaxID=2884022 RepID=A0A9E7C2R1_9ACTN|nr:class I SAM-dependent methyltransferase [Capillimicrobium parvum]UGS38820.1 hypothetical protein DSM104329_05250 [Capillimicrobium parvum]